ncbi:DUF6087 family protein [Streptomyces sp. NPDC059378]|uniref:DUF6087 family protein n=1 Tax=Streptomyces sp. NPDC059378 TaxID=3346815 RepID=UPI0036B31276
MERWAERRDKRLRPVGECKAIHLGNGPQRAAHLDPDAPRRITEWDGYQLKPVTTVANFGPLAELQPANLMCGGA